MAKHGPERHYTNPYVTYVTSRRQPSVGAGFNPVSDTAAIAARFVAPTGLAGPVGTIELMGRRTRRRLRLLGAAEAPTASLRQRWINFWARVRANIAANKFVQDMRIRPALPPGSVVTVDASPRGPAPSATALPVGSGWAPEPQSAATAAIVQASYSPAQGDPPNMGPVVTGVTMDPAGAAFPAEFWNRVIAPGYPPTVAARANQRALFKWFGTKSPTNGGY
jgi:hypothetical protein